MRTNLVRRRRLLPKLAAATLLVLFSFGGFKLWVIFRDIERLGLNRVAGENKTAVVAPATKNSVPAPAVTPESSSGSVGAKPEPPEGGAENPVRGTCHPTRSRRCWWVPIWTIAIESGSRLHDFGFR